MSLGDGYFATVHLSSNIKTPDNDSTITLFQYIAESQEYAPFVTSWFPFLLFLSQSYNAVQARNHQAASEKWCVHDLKC